MESTLILQDLDHFAKKFWLEVQPFGVFAFHGAMGAGKTTLINALCRAIGVRDVTASPTFSIINEYQYIEGVHVKTMYHIDLYRLKSEDEVIAAGVEDCVYSGNICMVEWPEKAPALFDEQTVHIYIEIVNDEKRNIRIKLPAA